MPVEMPSWITTNVGPGIYYVQFGGQTMNKTQAFNSMFGGASGVAPNYAHLPDWWGKAAKPAPPEPPLTEEELLF